MRAQVTTRDVRMQLGPYRVTDLLGEGATGIVYRGADPSGRELAIKVLREELALSERERSRFLEEAERLRRVRHAALVEVVDAGVLPNGLPYIAMPFLHGASLAERLQRGPMRFDVALHLFEQLAGALQTLHRAGLVHRDIKPENIFVTEGDGHAMLLDLGIARDVSSGPSTTTHAGMIRGTPAYMAPERFFGSPATPATDIYELGVVLYLTLVGALPWLRFDDPTERMRPAPPSARGVVLPPRLSSTLMRALAVSPGERPSSAHDFASAVIEALSPESAHQIANHATAFVPNHMQQQQRQQQSADGYAPTAMAPVLAPSTSSGIRATAPGPAPEWVPAKSTTSPMQAVPMHSAPPHAPVPVPVPVPGRRAGPSSLLIGAMTGASLLGSGALALVLFLRSAPSSPPSPLAIASASSQAPITTPTATSAPPPAGAPLVQASTDGVAEETKASRSGAAARPREPRRAGGPGSTTTSIGASAPAEVAAKRLPTPFPFTSMATSSLENCRILASYECSAPVKAVIGVGACNNDMMTLTLADRENESTRVARDNGCRMKLVTYRAQFDAQPRTP